MPFYPTSAISIQSDRFYSKSKENKKRRHNLHGRKEGFKLRNESSQKAQQWQVIGGHKNGYSSSAGRVPLGTVVHVKISRELSFDCEARLHLLD